MKPQHPLRSRPKDLSQGVLWLDHHSATLTYGATTIQAQRSLSGAFKVSEQSQVVELLEWAQCNKAALYPISSGRNWGYGSAAPVSDEKPTYIVDLSELKQVVDFDEQLGLVTLEPGVTQADLQRWLDERGFDFMVPVTGAGPNCSIVGNALERGYGITPYADHFAATTALKAYLADGSCYHSSLFELDQSAHRTVDKSFKWKLGPYLDGLFTQSNLGVVTEMTFRLAKRPEGFESFYVQFSHDSDLEVAVELMQGILRDFEGIVGSINILDQRRILSMMASNPNGPEQHRVMSQQQCEELATRFQAPGWMMMGSIYGSRSVVKAVKKEVYKRVKRDANRVLFSRGKLMGLIRTILRVLPGSMLAGVREQLHTLELGIEIMTGRANQVALPLAYWRNPNVIPEKSRELNPARDGCGLSWYAPLVPTKPVAMRAFVDLVRSVCPKYGIEPLITLTNLRYDLTDSTVPILFNAQDPEAVVNAKACLEELVEEGFKQGCVPYRMNIKQQLKLLDPSCVCWNLVSKLKKLLDPSEVIAPGRYQPYQTQTNSSSTRQVSQTISSETV